MGNTPRPILGSKTTRRLPLQDSDIDYKDPENKIIEREHARDKSKMYYVLLRKNMRLAIIEKINPKNENELIVSFYRNNVLTYEIISESDILPISSYETIKERNNKINRILK